MNKQLFRSHIVRHDRTQANLAAAIGLSLARLNAKINEYRGAEFTQSEMDFIRRRYHLTDREVMQVFLQRKYLKMIQIV